MPIFDTTPSNGGKTYTAGDGISIAGDQISVRVSDQADNIIGFMNDGLYAGAPIPTGVLPLVEIRTVPAAASVQVTGTKGDASVNGTTDENGQVSIEVPSLGVWTFSATVGSESVSQTVAVNASAIYPVLLSSINVFGVAWDTTNPSTQLTRLTPQTDPNGLVTVAITEEPQPAVGTGAGSSPFDQYMPWSGMYVCNLNATGEETAKKGEAGFSYATADVMVYIPEFYCRVINTTNIRYFYISDKAFGEFEKHPGSGRYKARYPTDSATESISGLAPVVNIGFGQARENAHSKGSGWNVADYAAYAAIFLLYLVEFSDWNSQLAIGIGNESTSTVVSGGTDDMSYHTGSNGNSIQYRYLENIYANVWELADGINGISGEIYVCTNPEYYATATSDNYTSTHIQFPSVRNSFIVSLGYSEDFQWVFIPIATGGSSLTYISDIFYGDTTYNTGVVLTGSYGDRSGRCGMFAFYAADPTAESGGTQYTGYRLMYVPQEVTA